MGQLMTGPFTHPIFARAGFTVEVGSGGSPHWRSDLLTDKFVADSAERPAGVEPLIIDRPFVVADACHLPFRSKSVDLLIARNLVEHIVDAELLFREMTRASRKGYITTPSALAEKVFGWSKHVWFVSIDEGVLTLRPKKRALYDASLSRVFHSLHREDRSFRRFYAKNRHLFVVEYRWEGSLEYRIEGYPQNVSEIKTTEARFDLDRLQSVLTAHRIGWSLRGQAASTLRWLVSDVKLRNPLDVIDRLSCPVCKGPLAHTQEAHRLKCSQCGSRYPIIEDVPVLLPEVADQV